MINFPTFNPVSSSTQTNLLWKAKEYPSLENCVHVLTGTGSESRSVIIGIIENKIFRVEYLIRTNAYWQTEYVEIRCQFPELVQSFAFHADGMGHWKQNGLSVPEWDGCIDVDLPLTPFTNTLPIKRLQLEEKQTQEIKVVYIDLIKQEVKPVKQKYTRLSLNEYRYENVPNDFETVIVVDESGLVVDYPGLFERISKST